jgi:hypothetical protein
VPHPTCRSPRAVPSELLDLLAEQLLAAHLEGGSGGAALVRVGAAHTAEALDIGLLPLPDGVHPVDVLVGEVLPARWWANGVVASARARSLDGATPVAPVALVVLAARDGRCVHRFDGPTELLPPGTAPPTGRVVDLLLRTMGCATPPPDEPPVRWWDAVWLDRIAGSVLAGEARDRDLGQLAELHPLLARGATPEEVVALHRGQEADPVAAWREVRSQASRPEPPSTIADGEVRAAVCEHLAPDEVEWMDEGSLARWLDAELPPLSDLLQVTDALLAPEVATTLRTVVGVPTSLPRDHRDQG